MSRKPRVGCQPLLDFDQPADRYYCSDCGGYDCVLDGEVVDARPLNETLAALGYQMHGGLYGCKTITRGPESFCGTASQVWHWLVRRGEVDVRRRW